jgi:hypothetical protein
VRFSAQAAEQLATFHRRRQGMLERAIDKVATSAPVAPSAPGAPSAPTWRLVQVRTPMDIAACELLEDEGLVLVYAVVPRRELLRMLWGSEVDEQ